MKDSRRSLLDLNIAEARQMRIICSKTSSFLVWLNLRAQLSARSLYSVLRSHIS
jgi:hypothetical protein